MLKHLTAAALAALALAACGDDTENPDPEPTPFSSQRCENPAEYLAFDPVNHAPQDLRLRYIDEMVAEFDAVAATFSASAAADAASRIEAKLTGADANLKAKMQGRKDLHWPSTDARYNVDSDADGTNDMVEGVEAGIAMLRGATTAQDVKIAKQIFQKAGTHRFIYLSVNEELRKPTKQHYDEAYGYLGTGPANTGTVRGLAAVAKSRDQANNTTLQSELFAGIKEGACTLEKALFDLKKDTFELSEHAGYAAHVETMDQKLQLVIAYSLGHELYDVKNKATLPEAHVALIEGEGFFAILKPYLLAAGGAKAQYANDLQAAIDTAKAGIAANSTTWRDDSNAQVLLERLEALYGIDVIK